MIKDDATLLDASVGPPTDRRLLRSQRTRAKIISAYLSLVHRNRREPSMREVAGHAGCALRSVFERFSNAHTMRLAALDHILMNTGLWQSGRPVSDSPRECLRSLVDCRIGEYARCGVLMHHMRQYMHLPGTRECVGKIRSKILDDHLKEFYRRNFTGVGDDTWLTLLDAATSLENWQRLHLEQGLPSEAIGSQWIQWISDVLVAKIPRGLADRGGDS
jgi:hypothetical protein